MATATSVILQGGAVAKNVFWVVSGTNVNLGSDAVLPGTVLSANAINLLSGATVNGKLLS
jgi:ice-binding like protein